MRSLAGLALLPCVLAAGCGPRLTVVTGRVTSQQQPLTVGKQGQVHILFTPVGAQGEFLAISHSSTVDANGAYILRGQSGRGIPPGKYHVLVRQYDPHPITDKLKGFFASPSQVVCEVAEGKPVNIELSEWERKKTK